MFGSRASQTTQKFLDLKEVVKGRGALWFPQREGGQVTPRTIKQLSGSRSSGGLGTVA